MLTSPDHATVIGWLRRFGAAVRPGRIGRMATLGGGRARLMWDFPTGAEARLAAEFVETLTAMTLEDAGAADEEIVRIVRDYHNGDDAGE